MKPLTVLSSNANKRGILLNMLIYDHVRYTAQRNLVVSMDYRQRFRNFFLYQTDILRTQIATLENMIMNFCHLLRSVTKYLKRKKRT